MTNKLVKKEEAALAVNEHRSFLMNDIPIDRVKVPRLSLLQSNSDSVQLLGHNVGTYENSITNENYGETLSLIPIKLSFGALYLKQGEGLKCRSNDGIINMNGEQCISCPFNVYYKKWGAKGEKPECSETVDIICLTSSLSPVVITFRNTSAKEGKKLASALKFNQKLMAFKLGSIREKNDKGTFFISKVMGFEPVDDVQYQAAEAFRKQVTMQGVDIQDSEQEAA